MLLKPAVMAAILAGVAVVAFVVGWAVENWRKSGAIEKLRGENALLVAAGGKCAIDVKNTRAAMEALADAANRRIQEAEEAMRQAEPAAQERSQTILRIKALPPVPIDKQCEAIQAEQAAYVAERRK